MDILSNYMHKVINVNYYSVKGVIKTHINNIPIDYDYIDLDEIINHVCRSVKTTMPYDELCYYIADYCASKVSYHPDFNKIASKISMDILHYGTTENFKQVILMMKNNVDRNGDSSSLINDELFDVVMSNSERIQQKFDFGRDYFFDYFGIKTLERSYLCKIHYIKNDDKTTKISKIIERPQHMIMRVALGIHMGDLEKAFNTYDLISNKYFTHATPTLFNAGTNRAQLSSCFLLHMSDSIEGIFSTITDIAKISKWSGGIGLTLSDIRAKGSLIRKTNGISDGIIPLCLVLDRQAKYVNQGGKRNGSIAVYLEPWHADIFEFCELRKNTKNEDMKARDLFTALWVCDLFMKRVLEGGVWSLMCPDECPGLTSSHGEEFEKLYVEYEKVGKYKKQVNAIELWYHILECQFETGMPYMLYKDHANKKSNQKNLGTIKNSNLCAEIIEHSDDENTAVCNLASICLPKFIELVNGKLVINYNKIVEVARVCTHNLDIVIDRNFYPTEKTKKSNSNHRPIGVGVQGLHDVFNILGVAFGSAEAREINKNIFESIYYGCVYESNQLAKTKGVYNSFKGSPFSEGKLQFHLWGLDETELSGRYNWAELIENVKKYGMRNSLLTTVMPTASTSQIMGNSEGIDPYLSNVFVRSTLAGEFIVINENLIRELLRLKLWTPEMRNKIIIMNGSIQDILEIPIEVRNVYKTAFEIKLKDIITLAADRGIFIDQSQSMNSFMKKPDFDILTSSHFYSWKCGLKTGMYYLRTSPAVNPIQFGIEAAEVNKVLSKILNKDEKVIRMCTKIKGANVDECLVCSS